MNRAELKEFLDLKAAYYETPSFIETDPILIPRLFDKKEDIEIAGFLAATIAWGNRLSIINSAKRLLALMDHAPYQFILEHQEKDLKRFAGFVHRTFNEVDVQFFVRALKMVYTEYGGMEKAFLASDPVSGMEAISHFREIFFRVPHQTRSEKHLSSPLKKSACKRLNMFLRWMVRPNKAGVDFGIWRFSPSKLNCPLDVHSGNVARKLGLLKRKANDSLAVYELDTELRKMNPEDPVSYDFALFGLGVFEKF
jgi:uncharacterized protein (TIGR02757 family)